MADIVTRPKITVEDLVQLDEDKRYEVVNGILKDNTVTAGFTHITITTNLYDLLKPYVRAKKLGSVYPDGLTYILHENKEEGVRDTRIPDFSFVRPGLIPEDWDRSGPFPGCPALAVEVVSPTEKSADLMEKLLHICATKPNKSGSFTPWNRNFTSILKMKAHRVFTK